MINTKNPQPGSFAHDHPAQSEMLRALTALYLEVPKEVADSVFEKVNAGVTAAINAERAACAEVARTTTAYRRPTVEPASGPRRSGPGSILAETIAQAIEARADAAEQEGR